MRGLDSKQDFFEALVLLGRMEMEAGYSDKALPLLLRAAKSDSRSPEPFLCLGHLYFQRWKAQVGGGESDLDKARRCLQKALSLSGGAGTDAGEEAVRAGAALSDVYKAQVGQGLRTPSEAKTVKCCFRYRVLLKAT